MFKLFCELCLVVVYDVQDLSFSVYFVSWHRSPLRADPLSLLRQYTTYEGMFCALPLSLPCNADLFDSWFCNDNLCGLVDTDILKGESGPVGWSLQGRPNITTLAHTL